MTASTSSSKRSRRHIYKWLNPLYFETIKCPLTGPLVLPSYVFVMLTVALCASSFITQVFDEYIFRTIIASSVLMYLSNLQAFLLSCGREN